jgi:hypothetical protein
MMNRVSHTILSVSALACVLGLSSGCELRKKMYDQPRYEEYESSAFFANGMASRPLVEGTVPRGWLREDDHFYRGRINGELAENIPMDVTAELLARGRERYNIYCSVCHDPSGYGNGMVVQRGFKLAASFHMDRLRASPDGYYFEVISRGFGMMPSYAYQIKPEDRWAIVAYVRALQLSQHATLEDVPEDKRAGLQGGKL